VIMEKITHCNIKSLNEELGDKAPHILNLCTQISRLGVTVLHKSSM
jgi:hypothetical protein